jgi:hypothetical protein
LRVSSLSPFAEPRARTVGLAKDRQNITKSWENG